MSWASSAVRARPQSERVDPELAVVRSRGRAIRVWSVLVTFMAVAVLFGLVGFQAVIVRNQSRLDDLEARVDQAHRANSRLRLDVAELQAPDRIRAVALAVGMIEPDVITYLEPISAAELAHTGDGGN